MARQPFEAGSSLPRNLRARLLPRLLDAILRALVHHTRRGRHFFNHGGRRRRCPKSCSGRQRQLQHRRESSRSFGDAPRASTGRTRHGDGVLPSPWPLVLSMRQRWFFFIGVHAGNAAKFSNSGHAAGIPPQRNDHRTPWSSALLNDCG